MMNISAASPGKKILIWLAVLALILACVPATATPVATLNPNEINLLIKQTADAASIQTLTAFPTITTTPTSTATPRNTFTPEASNTPFVTFVLPTPTPLQRVQFFRVKHDTQLAIYNYKSRTADPGWDLFPQTPEIAVLYASPSLTSGTQRTSLNAAWENYLNNLNGNDRKKIFYLKSADTALFNTAGFPKLESLTMGGNIITLDAIQGGWGKVHTMAFGQVGNAETENYTTRPDIVHKWVLVAWSRKSKSTSWSSNTPHGAIYWPLVSSNTVWIPMDRIEPFPILPMDVTVKVEQEIRQEPGKDGKLTGETLSKGQTVTITKYQPMGSQVWGRLPGGRWIALFMYQKTGPTYFTTWSMETLPPP
jgi:hypothetical protein